ncbi:hypothetical protein MNBD_CHLOROFLEXI01-3556 [hydrothermal vent metagenome]|uniref:Uncharacterized protein n=1 Tax=hydrothermal vent metagenome TaxID=652676 RepID=A0A3B0UPK3_9ZZZZ
MTAWDSFLKLTVMVDALFIKDYADLPDFYGSFGACGVDTICRGGPCACTVEGDHKGTPLHLLIPHEILKSHFYLRNLC